jgi:hypothetical protein
MSRVGLTCDPFDVEFEVPGVGGPGAVGFFYPFRAHITEL